MDFSSLPKLKKLVIAFSNLGEQQQQQTADTESDYIGQRLCQLLSSSEQSLEILDLRCCNLSLRDIQALQEAIKGNTRLNLREINLGLNKFGKTDLRSFLMSNYTLALAE